MLAVLMGGGLVLFGIGGDVSGGLFDAIQRPARAPGTASSRTGSTRTRRRSRPTRKNEAALEELVRAALPARRPTTPTRTRAFTDEGKERLCRGRRRLAALPRRRPEEAGPLARGADAATSTAPAALEQAGRGRRGGRDRDATAQPSAQAYLQLTTYAAAAGQDRKAELAGQKAIELAPKKQRRTVKQLRRSQGQTQAAPPRLDDQHNRSRHTRRGTDLNFHIQTTPSTTTRM